MSIKMSVHISPLFSESDNLFRVFSFLNFQDLCSAEVVCHYWRHVIEKRRIWSKKLVQKNATNKSWAYAIKQFGDIPTDGKEAKKLYYFLSSTILTEDLTSSSYPAELYRRRSLSSFQTIQTKIQSISPSPVVHISVFTLDICVSFTPYLF